LVYNIFVDKILKTAIFDSLATTAYIIAISTFLYFAAQAKLGQNNNFLVPMVMLFLLVFSAALTGFLVFGQPAILYLDGKKKEALNLLAYTLAILFGVTFLAIVILIIFSSG